MDTLVKAIREDKLVGAGSCTSIDECFDDHEIAEELQREGITTVEGAIKWARDREGLWLEQGLNCRWGEDDDPQLKAYYGFNSQRDEE